MPLSVLHEYRYVYNLPCSSSFSSQINSIVLSQGVGLRSATAISIRRKQLQEQEQQQQQQQILESSMGRADDTNSIGSSTSKRGQVEDLKKAENILHRPSAPAQGRVAKTHLATAVRKHFNNTAISEQDAIARFLYKVNEERRGKEFRLRFQP
ncbi:hypothetical protein FQN49_008960 [Arthroderma sp. PD_2]|nr:hypothetical protein FQN49_008960 [Arthroderma sp. PD_2]